MILAFICTVAVIAFVLKVFFFKMKYPEKNIRIAVMNTLLGPLRTLSIGPYSDGELTMEKAMKTAIAKTGLNDFGDLKFVEAYKILTDTAYYNNLTTTNVGYLVSKKEMQINLTKKLRVVEYLKQAPEVLQIPINAPIIVFGLGRSGTTFVHRLISLDPKNRAPRLWELLIPAPNVPPTATRAEFEADREKRLQLVREKIAERNRMGQSAMEEFHEIGAELPEEDMIGLAAELPTGFQQLYTFLTHPDGFQGKLESDRVVFAYKKYRQMLQLLSYQIGDMQNKQRWVLKFPVHVLFIAEIAKAFPDAKLVWAHRHPEPTVASLSAMMCTLHDIYYDKETCDHKQVGRSIGKLCNYGLPKAMKDIETTKIECAHVIFNDLVKDPIAVVRSIYKQFDMEYTQEFENAMKAYLIKNNAERKILRAKVEATGKEFDVHHIEDYGLKPSDVVDREGYAEYLKRFHFPEVK